MTTVFEVAARLARRMKGGSLPGLGMPAAADIVEALNAGLAEVYESLPAWQRRTTVSLTLAAPVNVNLSVVNGSVELDDGGSIFLNEQIGRSVVVAGDTNWNEVQSTTKLVDEYQGETGVQPAIIYGDSVFNDVTTFEGLVGHPIFADTREPLLPYNARAAGRAGEVGKPQYYWAEPAAASLGGAPSAFLRVFPAPDRAYVIRCDMEFRASRLTYSSLSGAAALPIGDHFVDRALIPLAEARLLRSPEWSAPQLADLVLKDADAARRFLSGQRSSVTVPNNRVGTPPGY